MKKILILGATGSIGSSALKVIRENTELFKLVGLSSHTQEEQLLETAREFNVKVLALSGREPKSDSVAFKGAGGLIRMIEESDADIVINGISGAAGLEPSIASIQAGSDLALANKETMVMAGKLVNSLARARGVRILPVDSEHAAVFQLLKNSRKNQVSEIILTASGGAFRDLSIEELSRVSLRDALHHPTWKMGTKITIDSATMANKGLEVIEAAEFFGFGTEAIKVLIHPQSMVHSLIRTIDGALYAQISKPDMCLPIQNALTYPEMVPLSRAFLDLAGVTLSFSAPERGRYPLLYTAYEAARAGGALPIVFNAANEEAVNAFVEGRIRFTDIASVVEKTLEASWENLVVSIEQIRETDRKARERANLIRTKTAV